MDAKELMIGNWVLKPNAMDGYNIGMFKVSEFKYLKHFKPIPITEEWLLKMGFEKDGELGYRYYLLSKSLAYDLDDNCIRISDSWEWVKIYHVHQLQNLYFVLIGKELTIK